MQPEVLYEQRQGDVTLLSAHAAHISWKPAKQQVPGEVWVFQDYDGPKPTQFFESPYSYSAGASRVKIPPLDGAAAGS